MVKKTRYYSVQQMGLGEIAAAIGRYSENIVIDLSYVSVSNTNPVDPGKDFSENLKLVIDNLQFAAAVDASKFIYISSGGTVYGRSEDDRIREEHPTNPVSHYGIIKLASEKYVQMFCSKNKLAYNIIRPSNVYGPGQIPFRGQGIISTAIASAYKNEVFPIYGKGENIRDYIYVSDFCNWLLPVIDSGRTGEIYNAGSGIGHSIDDIVQTVRQRIAQKEYPVNIQYHPARTFDVNKNVLDNGKIIAVTGIACSSDLAAGIDQTAEWIRENVIENNMF